MKNVKNAKIDKEKNEDSDVNIVIYFDENTYVRFLDLI